MAGNVLFRLDDQGQPQFTPPPQTPPAPSAKPRGQVLFTLDEQRRPRFTPAATRQPEYDPTANMGAIERALVSLGRGFTDTYEGIKQTGLAIGEKVGLAEPGAAQEYAESVRPERELYERDLGDDTIANIGRLVGQTAPLMAVPIATPASALARIGTAAATGGAAGGLQLVDEDKGQSRLENIATGAALGAGSGALLEGASRVAGKLINTGKGVTGNPAAREVLDLGREQGIPVYAQDVSSNPLLRSATTTAEQLPVVGLGGARRAQQDAARSAAERFKDKFADAGENTGQAVQESLSRNTERLKRQAGRRYDLVEQLADPLGPVPLPKLQATVKNLAAEQNAIPDITGSRAAGNKILEQPYHLSV